MGPPTVSKAHVKYPIFAATFAHNNPAILVVGGGGGAGRSGVPNAISAFDTSSRAPTLEPFANIDLPRDEDSVTSIASVSTREGSILYAGVNSSEEDCVKGQNTHFRAYQLDYPKTKKTGTSGEKEGKIEPVSKTQLFSTASEAARKEGYQRIVRLSPPGGKSGGKRIGVVGSSLKGNENELVIFSAVSTKPTPSEVIQRVPLKEKEVNDVDIIETEDGHFQVAYCVDSSVYVQRFTYDFNKKKSGKKLQAPAKRYESPHAKDYETKSRSKIRGLRWLSPSHLLLLVNRPNKSGVELQVLRLYSEDGIGSIIRRKTLSGAKQAVDMDVVRLNADQRGAYQILIAVATQDVSLHIYTVDYTSSGGLSGFASFAVYYNVHDVQMTKLVWSPFQPPASSASNKDNTPCVRLASTSLSGSISVDTFDLRSASSGPKSQYVLSSAWNRRLYSFSIYAASTFIVLMFALMVQSLLDPQGNWTKGIVPASLQNAANAAKPPGAWMDEARGAKVAVENAVPPVAKTRHRIRDLLHLHGHEKHEDAPQKALVIHHDPEAGDSLSTEVHHGEEDVVKRHTEAKKWEELSHAERKRWKDKLVDAGMWTVEEGETILKSIFFSQAAGLVGHVAQGVMNR